MDYLGALLLSLTSKHLLIHHKTTLNVRCDIICPFLSGNDVASRVSILCLVLTSFNANFSFGCEKRSASSTNRWLFWMKATFRDNQSLFNDILDLPVLFPSLKADLVGFPVGSPEDRYQISWACLLQINNTWLDFDASVYKINYSIQRNQNPRWHLQTVCQLPQVRAVSCQFGTK